MVASLEELRYAEVQKLGYAVRSDQDVCRLQISMNDQILVRIPNGIANLREKLKALPKVQVTAVAIAIDGFAFDVLHDEVRLAVFHLTGIQEACNVRMVQVCENLTLGPEEGIKAYLGSGGVEDLDANNPSITED